MKRKKITLTHQFLDFIPDKLQENTVYISIKYRTVVHLCCCGCKRKVVTPLHPTDWKIIFSGKSISIYPSIGNWSFPCKSHYWIKNNIVVWAKQWTKKDIDESRKSDKNNKSKYFDSNDITGEEENESRFENGLDLLG